MEKRSVIIKPYEVYARDLPDLWFQAVDGILDPKNGARTFTIDKGSYDGDGNKNDAQTRLQYDFFIGHVLNPGEGAYTPKILPEVPQGVTPPVLFGYVYGDEAHPRPYLEKVMTSFKQPGESYTYGERLTKAPLELFLSEQIAQKLQEPLVLKSLNFTKSEQENLLHGIIPKMTSGRFEVLLKYGQSKFPEIIEERGVDGNIIFEEDGRLYLNQVEAIIDTYKKFGPMNNQMVLQVSQPSDIMLKDPPCLRSIGTRILEDKFHFDPIEFRSWDLWGGLPANLPALQALKEYMADSIGIEDGEMLVTSQGLHLYGYGEDVVRSETFQKYLGALKTNGILKN